jgi:chromosome partitioning protein
MAMIVGIVSQKGGVGKSMVARLIAREIAAQDWQVKIADLDISQATSFHWRSRRLQRGLEPDISVEQYGRVDQVLKVSEPYDLLILDGAPHATQATLQVAKASHLVILPTGLAIDDLQPGVQLAHELATHVPRQHLVFALCRVGISQTEIDEAR